MSFFGTHQNRLDAKGRVSVPAAFRTALRDANDPDAPVKLVLRPSFKHHCIEAWPMNEFAAVTDSFGKLNRFSDTYSNLATAFYADAYEVESDKEGRIVVPPDLAKFAALEGQAVFMGVGNTFEIWQPDAAERRKAEARDQARAQALATA